MLLPSSRRQSRFSAQKRYKSERIEIGTTGDKMLEIPIDSTLFGAIVRRFGTKRPLVRIQSPRFLVHAAHAAGNPASVSGQIALLGWRCADGLGGWESCYPS